MTNGTHLTIAEILRAGKARIIEGGWCQGHEKAIHSNGRYGCCAGTALCFIATDNMMDALNLLKRANDITTDIGAWNDAPERTLEDVLAAYDKAIAAAEATEKPE